MNMKIEDEIKKICGSLLVKNCRDFNDQFLSELRVFLLRKCQIPNFENVSEESSSVLTDVVKVCYKVVMTSITSSALSYESGFSPDKFRTLLVDHASAAGDSCGQLSCHKALKKTFRKILCRNKPLSNQIERELQQMFDSNSAGGSALYEDDRVNDAQRADEEHEASESDQISGDDSAPHLNVELGGNAQLTDQEREASKDNLSSEDEESIGLEDTDEESSQEQPRAGSQQSAPQVGPGPASKGVACRGPARRGRARLCAAQNHGERLLGCIYMLIGLLLPILKYGITIRDNKQVDPKKVKASEARANGSHGVTYMGPVASITVECIHDMGGMTEAQARRAMKRREALLTLLFNPWLIDTGREVLWLFGEKTPPKDRSTAGTGEQVCIMDLFQRALKIIARMDLQRVTYHLATLANKQEIEGLASLDNVVAWFCKEEMLMEEAPNDKERVSLEWRELNEEMSRRTRPIEGVSSDRELAWNTRALVSDWASKSGLSTKRDKTTAVNGARFVRWLRRQRKMAQGLLTPEQIAAEEARGRAEEGSDDVLESEGIMEEAVEEGDGNQVDDVRPASHEQGEGRQQAAGDAGRPWVGPVPSRLPATRRKHAGRPSVPSRLGATRRKHAARAARRPASNAVRAQVRLGRRGVAKRHRSGGAGDDERVGAASGRRRDSNDSDDVPMLARMSSAAGQSPLDDDMPLFAGEASAAAKGGKRKRPPFGRARKRGKPRALGLPRALRVVGGRLHGRLLQAFPGLRRLPPPGRRRAGGATRKGKRPSATASAEERGWGKRRRTTSSWPSPDLWSGPGDSDLSSWHSPPADPHPP